MTRGDVVAFTDLTWSPYLPTTDVGGTAQNQFEFGAAATLTVIGPGRCLPRSRSPGGASELGGDVHGDAGDPDDDSGRGGECLSGGAGVDVS